jgi:hypothetical protein
MLVQAQRENRGIALPIFNLSTRRVWVVIAVPQMLYPCERDLVPIIQRPAGPGADLDRYRKSRPYWGFEPWTVQPIANCCINCAILATVETYVRMKSYKPWYSKFRGWFTSFSFPSKSTVHKLMNKFQPSTYLLERSEVEYDVFFQKKE